MRPLLALAARLIDRLRWAPFVLGGLGFAVLAALGSLRVDLFDAALAGLLGVAWWIGKRLYAPAVLFSLLLLPCGWHFLVSLPAADPLRAAHSGTWLAVEGTIRDRWLIRGDGRDGAASNTVRMLLGDVRIERGETEAVRSGTDSERSEADPAPSESPAGVSGTGAAQGQTAWTLAEAVLELPAKSAWTFRSGRRVRAAGALGGAVREQHRLRIGLSAADYHFVSPPFVPGGADALRARLKARAAYYLGKEAQAVYLPLVLDLRDRESPEGRDVIQSFRRVGISHLFAISGLNIAMIFGLLMVLQRYVTWVLSPGQGWVHGRTAARLTIVGLIWAYIALIGFPVPAVRAAVMGTLLIWTELWGTRTPGLYVLAFTGLVMLALTPSVVYDISFQLSFLAYFFLVLAMDLGRQASRWLSNWLSARLPAERAWWRGPAWLARAADAGAANLWVTLIVTLGLWPLIAERFHNFSFLVFAGNLLLVPAMELALLPVAMVALTTSLAFAAAAPGQWAERAAFGLLEAGLSVWVRVVHVLDRLGAGFVFRVVLDWPAQGFALYYAALLGALAGGIALGRRRYRD